MAAIFRRTVDEFIGRSLMYSVHSQELDKLIRKVAVEGTEAEAHIDILMPREKHFFVLALPVYDQQNLSAVLTVWQDVTARHRVDAVRRAFIANVSHELKTPVAGINLLADSLVGAIDADEPAAKRFAVELAGKAKLLSQLIRDLLDLSQLEAPEVKTLFAPVSTAEVVKETVAGFTETAAAKGVSLQTDLPINLPFVDGSRDQLRLMTRNLIENAVHYTSVGGSIKIALAKEDDNVVFEISDTGIGIPATDRRRIFERFYRVDKARSRQTGGTGLGLSIVKHVVDNHQGKIKLDSIVGVGSRFKVILPIRRRPNKTSESGLLS